MNDALTSESAASRQRVLEAYRGQLRLVRSRLDPIWRAHAASLNAPAAVREQRFEHLITSESVDGAILLNAEATVEYPDRVAAHRRRDGSDIEQRLLTTAR